MNPPRTLKLIIPSLIWITTALAAQPTAAVESNPSGLLLGVEQGTPLVYFKPADGLILILSPVTYDGFGRPESYTLELGFGSASRLTVQVRRTSEAKTNPPKFIARAGEHTLAELSAAKTKEELVALNPAGAGGVVLAAVGELVEDVTTNFAYDDFGRRTISAQTFVHAGAKWKVTFSDYTHDRGRLTGYKVLFSKAE